MLAKISATLACAFLGSSALGADRTIMVGDAPIHVSESGAGSNVVFESGMGEGPAVWNDVIRAVQDVVKSGRTK